MPRPKPPAAVTTLIDQILRADYGGVDGDQYGALFHGLLVCKCPFCGTIMAIYYPDSYRLTCVRCTHKGGKGWRQIATRLGIEIPD
jgi:hypothetical protein